MCRGFESLRAHQIYGGRSSIGRAPDCGSGGSKFETCRPPHILFKFGGVSPSGKARDFDSRIRRFKSCHPSQKHGPLAQSAEHVTFNHGVPGSNLGWITTRQQKRLLRYSSLKFARQIFGKFKNKTFTFLYKCTFSSVGRATDS